MRAWPVAASYLPVILCVDAFLACGRERALARAACAYWGISFLITLAILTGIARAEDASLFAAFLFASAVPFALATPFVLLQPLIGALPFNAGFTILLTFCGLNCLLSYLIARKRR